MIETTKRPVTLVIGCVMAWVGGALGLIGGIIAGTTTLDARQLADRFAHPSDAAAMIHAFGFVCAIWSVLVIVVAALAFGSRRWAALTLVVMAVLAIVILVVTALSGSSLWMLPALWSAVSAALVYRRPVSSESSA